ncbi:hypothetical protein T02_6116 [Trichinella nativa]|uniref:Uncharacterized protein n=1 Tax=Trichinella nativa TaxID=6335 RepID=A0A0V1KT03_9BILA|nr:hypothetical protein T02_6116 [Trichinella nativa]
MLFINLNFKSKCSIFGLNFKVYLMCDGDHEIAPAHHVYLFVGRPAVKGRTSVCGERSSVVEGGTLCGTTAAPLTQRRDV